MNNIYKKYNDGNTKSDFFDDSQIKIDIQTLRDLYEKKSKLKNQVKEKKQNIEVYKRQLQSITKEKDSELLTLVAAQDKNIEIKDQLIRLIEKKNRKETRILNKRIQNLEEESKRNQILLRTAQKYSDVLKLVISFMVFIIMSFLLFKNIMFNLWNEEKYKI